MSHSTTEYRLLSKRYRIEAFLGQGGMARVHRGTDLVLERTVAVKVLADHMARDPQSVRRFRREAQAAAGLSHPGIVSVYDTGSDGEVHFIVMEHVTGRTLADVLQERGSLEPGRAVGIGVAIASALDHAHGKGIVHRDIKPANVMITPAQDVKVMDFGIARAVSSTTLTETAAILGTATYFAPEQARGEPVDARSDLYALGVVLYEMLTGRPPFVADSPVAVAYKHVREAPIPPSQLNPRIDATLEGVVLKAMAKERGARHQTAEELVRDLERVWADGTLAVPRSAPAGVTGPVSVRQTAVLPPVDPPGPVGTPRRRHRRSRSAPWILVSSALVALALVAGLLLTGLSRRPTGSLGTGSPSPSNSPGAVASAASPSAQAPTTTRTPAHQAPTSIQGALTQLSLLLNEGVDSGDLTGHAASVIGHAIERSLRDYQDGDVEGALEKLDKLQDRVGELQSQGEVAPGIKEELHQGVADLQTTMRAASPPADEEGED